MVAFPRCLSALALLTGGAGGARIVKQHTKGDETKFIAGVPVFNYHTAYAGESLGDLGAEGEWVVIMNPNVTDADIKNMCHWAKHGCNLQGSPSHGGVPFFEMRGTESDLEAVIKIGAGAVKFVEPDGEVTAIPELTAEDAEAGLWGLERIGAYKRPSEGDGVTVFVFDTGVRTTHQDFGGRGIPTLDMSSGSLVECNGDLSCAADRDGHGTHCAGTAAGTTYGVAPRATVRAVKVLSDQGGGSWSWSIGALNWLATTSIRPAVASMSLGSRGKVQALKNAVDAATGAGVSVVVAAGNSNKDACGYSPAFVPAAITIGSTDYSSRRSSFSSYGSCVNLWAPGSSILSAGVGSDTASATMSGTSMACPHVSGGAALVLEANPSFNYAQVLDTLQANARRDSITGLKHDDINAELYVGSDAPPPAGTLPPPAPTPAPTAAPKVCETETSHKCGPSTGGVCNTGRWCSKHEWCWGPADRHPPFDQWSNNYGGACSQTPAPTPAPTTPAPSTPAPTPAPTTPAPSPSTPAPTTPAPSPSPDLRCETETGHTCGPVSWGVCHLGRWCSRFRWCGVTRDPNGYDNFSNNHKGACDGHPVP